MSAADLIIAALQRECPTGEAMSLAVLRNRTGLQAADVKAAVQSLRYQGKLDWDRIALSPSQQVADTVDVRGDVHPAVLADEEQTLAVRDEGEGPGPGDCRAPAAAEAHGSLAREIAEEARAAGRQRQKARTLGNVGAGTQVDLDRARRSFDGTDLHALAMESPADIAQALQRRWGDLWPRLVAQARAAQVRPIPFVVELLEGALKGEARA